MQAFDFDLDHAFGFYRKLDDYVFDSPVRYELFADLDGDREAQSVKRTTIAQAFPEPGSTMQFLFDYGDDWRFRVEVIGLGEKAPKTRYPKILKTVGQAPPAVPRPRRGGGVSNPTEPFRTHNQRKYGSHSTAKP